MTEDDGANAARGRGSVLLLPVVPGGRLPPLPLYSLFALPPAKVPVVDKERLQERGRKARAGGPGCATRRVKHSKDPERGWVGRSPELDGTRSRMGRGPKSNGTESQGGAEPRGKETRGLPGKCKLAVIDVGREQVIREALDASAMYRPGGSALQGQDVSPSRRLHGVHPGFAIK